MAPPKKNVSQATVVAPSAPKEKRKSIEAAEPADRQTNLSDVYIHDDEDSHSSFATPQRVLAEPEAYHTSEQLHHMLSNLKKQMEDQQAEMIRLCKTAALEKDAAARIQTRLLKQVNTLRKSQSSDTAEGRARTPVTKS